jgi:molybdenum cofactor biosynthesis enzyme MoaA
MELISSSISMKNHIKKALNDAYDLGLEDILIGGGEPLLVKDLVIDIIKHAKNLGVIVRVETNGLLIDSDLANFSQDMNAKFL